MENITLLVKVKLQHCIQEVMKGQHHETNTTLDQIIHFFDRIDNDTARNDLHLQLGDGTLDVDRGYP
ncbi:MAG: hypothetical protein DSZ10_00940 [Sulfurovum sp.]|nr:MAG: hypothetical protein DSZ10_00940 [Sulfurovum sp.]